LKNNKHNSPEISMAKNADIHELYEEAVQSVDNEVEFIESTFLALRNRSAKTFREDFCGTASLCCAWVRGSSDRYAIGVDIDQKVLDWGKKNRINHLPEIDRPRVTLINQDVMKVNTNKVDLVGAFNFSYWAFKSRQQLREYFITVHNSLVDDGLLFLDAYGGSEAYEVLKEKTKCDGFTYIWRQSSYEPVTGNIICHIDFKFPDGSKIKKAFSYYWRLWSLPEIREVLIDSGFNNVRVYWEGEDDEGEGSGEFYEESKGEADPGWIAYIVAEK
tara:strand:+ start:3116 stop:3937 length:822 start_codon:yes stop_codon:yes gene_type:complete